MTDVALSEVHELSETTTVRDELDSRHVASLAEVLDRTPPIEVVETDDGYGVLDGYHRRAAAIWRKDETIRVRILDVPRERWLEHALLANGSHGKPMSLAERKRNAERLVLDRPDLSNNRIAAICGLSDDTVATIRPEIALPTSDSRKLEGIDGRQRPASRQAASAQREKVANFLRDHPSAPALAAAREVGVSPTTASDVKKRLEEGRPIDPAEDAPLPPFAIQLPDGTIADAGTPEANAEAQRLINAAKAAPVKHCPTCTCGQDKEVA